MLLIFKISYIYFTFWNKKCELIFKIEYKDIQSRNPEKVALSMHGKRIHKSE